MDFLNDIVERFDEETQDPPVLPPNSASSSAPAASFPKPSSKKFVSWRERKAAKEKQQQELKQGLDRSAGPSSGTGLDGASPIAEALRKATQKHGGRARDFSESEKIHIENLERLSKMSQEEIEQERNELLGSMDERVLRGLLKRAMARDKENDGMLDEEEVDKALGIDRTGEAKAKKSVSFDLDEDQINKQIQEETRQRLSGFSMSNVGVDGLVDDERYPSFETLQEIQREMDEKKAQEEMNVHFPQAAASVTDSLDPADPKFFEKLHEKYFPTLTSEPEKLEWMQSKTDDKESYSEDRDSLLPRELRFDFKGQLLSPRQSKEIPTHAGLHHHGDQPDAAGYTVLELAHLARSTISSQRAIAIQTLGRVLYRLGKGTYGAQIGAGLWGLIDGARVIETLTEASDEKKTRSMTVRAYAVEALWLWQQGGGGRPAV